MKLASVLTALAAVAQLCASAQSPTMSAYSETRSFRDALDGRSMEDAISGPVDRDTSSYGDRSGPPPLSTTPANGNLATGDSGVAAAAGTAASEDDVESTSAEPPAPVDEQLEREARVMRQPQSQRQQQITAPQAPVSPKAAQRREEFSNNDQQQQQQYMQQPQAQMQQISADFSRPRASVRQQQQSRIAQQSGRTMRMAARRKPTKMSPAQVNAMLNKMLGGGRMSAANAKLLSGMMKEMQKETSASAARRYQYRRLMMAAAMMQQRVADASRDYSETTQPAYGNQADDSSANYAPGNQQQLQQQMQMLQQKQYQQDDGQQQQQAKQDSTLATVNEDGPQQQVQQQQQQRQSGYGQSPTSVESDEEDSNNASGGLDNDSNMLETLGKPGVDFPVFSTPPETGFSCADQQSPGYYADVDAKCQAFYACQPDGRQDAFLCPNGTLFNQKFFVCDYYYHVDCNEAAQFYKLNANLYKSQPPSSSGAAAYNNGQQTTTPEAGGGTYYNQESQDGADYQMQSEQQQQGYSTTPVSLPMPIPTPMMPTMPMMRSSPANTGYAIQPKRQQQPAQMQVQVPTNQMNQMRMQTSPQEEEHALAQQKQLEYGSYKNGQRQVSPSPQMPIQMQIQMVPMNQMGAQVTNANPVSYRSVGQMQTMRKMAPEMQQRAYGAMQMNAAAPESGDSGYSSEDNQQQQQQQRMDYDKSSEQQQQSERQHQVQEKQQNGRMNRAASRSMDTSAGRYTPTRANNQQQQYMALRMRGQKGIMRATMNGYDAQMQRVNNINNQQQQRITASPSYIGNGKPMQMMQLMEPTAVPGQVQMGAQWPTPGQATTPSTTTSTNYERDPDAGFTNAKAAAAGAAAS